MAPESFRSFPRFGVFSFNNRRGSLIQSRELLIRMSAALVSLILGQNVTDY